MACNNPICRSGKGGGKKNFVDWCVILESYKQQQSAHGNANESIITLNSPTVFTSPCFQRPDRYVSTSAHLFESKLENSPQWREKRKRDGAQSLHSSFLREMGWCVCTHIGATVDDDYDISLSAISFSPAEKGKKKELSSPSSPILIRSLRFVPLKTPHLHVCCTRKSKDSKS